MMKNSVLIIASLLIIKTGCINGTTPSINNPVAFQYLHEEAQSFKKKNSIKGLTVALFDNEKILWSQSFGRSTYGFGINDSTMFSLQSVSKNITALAVMIAVEDGLLDLDTPISRYINDFSLNSCFEENPESIITLRMLISNTSGLPHEAPVGNNFDLSFPSVEEHLNSIGESWLRFPAGSEYSYSNNGFDLAAQIVERVSGVTFDEYLFTRVFHPLRMNNSTVNDQVFVNQMNKTEGIIFGVKIKHYPIPLVGSGAVYSSLDDMVKYVQFHMDPGIIDGKKLLSQKSLLEMYSVVRNNYGLGTYVDSLNGTYYLNHNGGGFGYGSSILWLPEYNIGCVVLSNKQANCYQLAASITSNYLKSLNPTKIKDSAITQGFNPFSDVQTKRSETNIHLCSTDSIFRDDWSNYIGAYEVVLGGMEFKWYAKLAFALGKKQFAIELINLDNEFWVNTSWSGSSKLYEYLPGLFFTKDGRALDLRSSNITFDNLRIIKF